MFFRHYKKSGRHQITGYSLIITFFKEILMNLLPAPILWALLAILPAAACGCSGEMYNRHDGAIDTESTTVLHFSGNCMTSKGSILDIFTFEDDQLRRLDSYNRIENFNGDLAYASSTGGEKIFFICSDGHRDSYSWSEISSYSSLEKVLSDLENESLDKQTRTGECRLAAGETSAVVDMRPLASEVILNSLSCDFSKTTYRGSRIEDIRIYLTNVNASYPIHSQTATPVRFVNIGMFNPYDVRHFKNPEIIVDEISDSLDMNTLFTETRFLCYPNPCIGNSPGSPETRLVIEGRIDSLTYYWPVTVNPGVGVERNCRYVYDIEIRRKGVSDPDIPINPEDIEIKMNIKPWTEKEGYGVGF